MVGTTILPLWGGDTVVVGEEGRGEDDQYDGGNSLEMVSGNIITTAALDDVMTGAVLPPSIDINMIEKKNELIEDDICQNSLFR